MKTAWVLLMGVFALTASLFAQQRNAFAPDEVFYNGKVITVDTGNSIQQAFAVKGNRFLAVGTNAAMRKLAGPQTKLTNLGGHAVIPGLMDDHIHPWRYVFSVLKGVDLTGIRSLQEMGDRIRQGAATAKGRTVYATGMWRESDLAEKRGPTRAELDQILPDRPLMVLEGRQKAFLNSAALTAAQITRGTKTVYGEKIPLDSNGDSTGVIPNSWSIMTAGSKILPIDDVKELWLQTQKDLNAQGFTSVREPMVPTTIMRMYWNLWREGKLTIRMAMGLDVGPQQADELEDILKPLGVGPDFGDHTLRLDSIGEFAVDGNTSTNPTPGMFHRAALVANRYGWRLSPHIVNDKGLDMILDAYQKADQEKPLRDQRWTLEHAVMMRTDQMDPYAKLGVLISAQFQPYRGTDNLVKTYGEERAEQAVPMREWLDHGLIVGAGSDWGGGPVTNPFVPIYFYVTRKTADGKEFGPKEKISRMEALRVSTINNAHFTFEEKVKGSIEADKLADFVVLSQDILTVPEEQILQIHPLATFMGGKKVFSSQQDGF